MTNPERLHAGDHKGNNIAQTHYTKTLTTLNTEQRKLRVYMHRVINKTCEELMSMESN